MSLLQTTTCLICHTNSNITIPLPCGCNQTCIDCLGEWILSRISPVQRDGLDQKITCPLDSCKKEFTLLRVYAEMPECEKARINEALLTVYLNKEPDIQKCPKQGCHYALLVDKSSCSKELQCESCYTKWRNNDDSLAAEEGEEEPGFFKKFLSELKNTKDEIFTFFWKIFKTKKCPCCKVRISREPGGCKMMSCTQCQLKFCWYCLKDGNDCDHGEIDDYGERRPSRGFWFLICLFYGLYWVFCGAMSIGAIWAFKTVGSWIISGIISLFA